MYIETVPNRNSRPAVLLREGWREGKKVKKRTLANLTDWPQDKVDALRMALSGVKLMALEEALDKHHTRTHGQVDAVLKTVKKLGLDKILSAKPCRERNLIVAMIVARVCAPDSKLAMPRWWKDTTLPELLDLDGVDEDDLYEAMDWLLPRQRRIEKKLAKRHLQEGDLVLYDLSSSYFEGETCPLAKRGKSRDRKRNTLQVNYGLVTTREGCPVSVSVYEGNTADSTTFMEQVHKVRNDFDIHEIVLVACRNAALGRKRGHKRISMLEATERELSKIRTSLQKGTLRKTERSQDRIGVRVGKVVNKYKMAKHFVLQKGEATMYPVGGYFEREGPG